MWHLSSQARGDNREIEPAQDEAYDLQSYNDSVSLNKPFALMLDKPVELLDNFSKEKA